MNHHGFWPNWGKPASLQGVGAGARLEGHGQEEADEEEHQEDDDDDDEDDEGDEDGTDMDDSQGGEDFSAPSLSSLSAAARAGATRRAAAAAPAEAGDERPMWRKIGQQKRRYVSYSSRECCS